MTIVNRESELNSELKLRVKVIVYRQTGNLPSEPSEESSPNYRYPTLLELDPSEIPAAPTVPSDIELVDPISITDAAGLQGMTPAHHYSIDADIDLSGVTWTPLVFNSSSDIVIEGNDHNISNLTINSPASDNRAFIGSITGTGSVQLRNILFSGCNVAGLHRVAIVLAGTSRATGQKDSLLRTFVALIAILQMLIVLQGLLVVTLDQIKYLLLIVL